ncbi:unnamed protein product [Owenia fusiformis]|uniref:Uncharacterized protein n=1 Tax=Owenia fusiformis TaxID=6347 RepID=A0A8J1TAZ7_OWEFU|nr:unnamed protein product [Owenia fusiformis]
MGKITQSLVKIIFTTICISITECSSSTYIGKLFNIAKNEEFIPDNIIPEVGHLRNIVTSSVMDCNEECVKHSKCTQTNVEQLTATTWNCDLFGLGRGAKISSPGHLHYFVPMSECPGVFLTTIHSGSSYCISHETLTWTDAEMKCLEYGATLATIEDSSEQADLVAYLLNNAQPSMSYNIGLSDRAEPEVWVWSGTGTTATYFSWGGADPQVANNERCVTMCSHRSYKWCDVQCSSLLGYICER